MGVNGAMIASAQLFGFIQTAEGRNLDEETKLHVAYKDTKGTGNPWTIGYGHTSAADVEIHGVLDGEEYHGTEVIPRLLIDEEEACRLLRIVIEKKANIVREAVQVPLNQNQFDALVDMAYNLGGAPFRKGSDILAALNGGVDDYGIQLGPKDYDRAEDEFLRWGKAQGEPLQALHSRRIAAALMSRGLPHQWALYNPAITLQVSLAQAEETAHEMDDKPFVEMKPKETYSRIIAAVKPHIEQPKPKPPPAPKPRKQPAPVQTKPPSAYTRQPAQVAYKIDPNAGLKPLEESSRVHGYVWQQIGIVGLRTAGATGVAGASAVAADPELGNALLALFVVAGVGITSTVIKSYGDFKRAKGEAEASQGLY